MELQPLVQWVVFSGFAFLSVAGALGMTTTMSMFRSGIFLMASFVGVAGLFILLMADLLGMLQVMMYIGGMLVMILFMLLFSHDPGGAMMASQMNLMGPEKLFSLGLSRDMEMGHAHHGENGHGERSGEGEHEGEGEEHHGGGGHGDMSMFTPIKKAAAVLACLAGAFLLWLLMARTPWKQVEMVPDQDSAARIGHLLMGKYMIAFEGAGLLILLGIFAAVQVSRPARHPDESARDKLLAAVDGPPSGVETDPLEPLGRREIADEESEEVA